MESWVKEALENDGLPANLREMVRSGIDPRVLSSLHLAHWVSRISRISWISQQLIDSLLKGGMEQTKMARGCFSVWLHVQFCRVCLLRHVSRRNGNIQFGRTHRCWFSTCQHPSESDASWRRTNIHHVDAGFGTFYAFVLRFRSTHSFYVFVFFQYILLTHPRWICCLD